MRLHIDPINTNRQTGSQRPVFLSENSNDLHREAPFQEQSLTPPAQDKLDLVICFQRTAIAKPADTSEPGDQV